AGEVSGPMVVVRDRPVQAGDRVLALRNAYRLGLRNGTLGTVAAVNDADGSLTLTTDDGRRLTVPATYLEAGHLTHGYALTVHKAQGATTERALLLGNDDLYQELGYVGLSRGRAGNHLYVVSAEPEDQERGTALGAEREAVAARVAEREAFLAAHQPQVERLGAITRRIESALARRLREVGREPPGYLVATLGRLPDDKRSAAYWWRGARAIETYRAR